MVRAGQVLHVGLSASFWILWMAFLGIVGFVQKTRDSRPSPVTGQEPLCSPARCPGGPSGRGDREEGPELAEAAKARTALRGLQKETRDEDTEKGCDFSLSKYFPILREQRDALLCTQGFRECIRLGGGWLRSGWISIQNCNYIKEQTEMGKAD